MSRVQIGVSVINLGKRWTMEYPSGSKNSRNMIYSYEKGYERGSLWIQKNIHAFVARITWCALMVPRGVRSACLAFSFLQASMLVTGVLVCRFKFFPLISLSRIKAMYLYGHNDPALVVSVAASAPLTLYSRSSSLLSISVTSLPKSGAASLRCCTSRDTASANDLVQKVRHPTRERHSHGMSCCSM